MGKILCNKIFWFVFQRKTPPISILKLEFKMGTENLSNGGGETHVFHRKNKNISSICHIKEAYTLPQVLGAFYFSMALLLISASMLQTKLCVTLEVEMQQISWSGPQSLWEGTEHLESTTEQLSHKENKIILCCFYFSLGKARLQQVLTTLLVQAQVFALINK